MSQQVVLMTYFSSISIYSPPLSFAPGLLGRVFVILPPRDDAPTMNNVSPCFVSAIADALPQWRKKNSSQNTDV